MITKSFFIKTFKFVGLHYLYIAFGLLILISSIVSPYFLTIQNIRNLLLQNCVISIVSMGMLLVIILRGIDLSVGSIVALAGSLASGFIVGWNPYLVILVVFLLMALVGSFNGILITYRGISPFITTLAMMTIIRGIAYIYQVGEVRVIYNMSFVNILAGNLGPVPIPVLTMVIIGVILIIVLRKTIFGRYIYAIGGSPESVYLAGINVKAIIIVSYAICSSLAGLAGLILSARLRAGSAVVGSGWELDAISAVIIGGAPLSGGRGSIINTIIGAFIIGIMNNLLNLLGVSTYSQMIVKGAIIIIAVMLQKE